MSKKVIKLVVAGPVNAGKTTLIQSLSDVPVVCTNEMATDEVVDLKELTTVAMDHGIWYPCDNLEIHLYGTPGQRRFDFMWEILAVGADALLLLADGSDAESLTELQYIQNHFGERATIPELLLISRADQTYANTIHNIASSLNMGERQIATCDLRDSQLTRTTLLQLIENNLLPVTS